MQVYQIPFNFEHEEKIFGGYISLRQAIYLIFILCSIGLFFVPIIDIYIKIALFVITAGIFIAFAFIKIDGINADKYSIYFLRFILRRKIYMLER